MKRLLALFIALVCINSMVFCQKKNAGQVRTIVIDAGHGGDKPGAVGKKSQEKTLTLQMALKLGKLIEDNCPDVKIIYTRTTDVDVALAERARLANKAKADLFLSIHCNSWTNPTPTGVETYVMGLSQSKANMEVAKKENADILLEKGYKDNSDYQGFDPNSPESYVMFAMYQNAYLDKSLDFAGMIQEQYKSNIKTINRGVKQAEIFVLYKTAMPAVLTEVGFISNPEEEQYMMSDEGQATIVVSIFKAFLNYKSSVEGTKVPTDLKIDLKGYKAKGAKNSTPTKETPKKTIESPTTEQANSTVEEPTEKKTEIPVASIPSTMLPSTAQTDVEPPLAIPEPEIKEPVKAVVTTTEDTPDNRVPAADASGVEYRVQFLSSNKELKEGARELKGVKEYSYYMQNGVYRYTTGNFKDVKAAVKRQKEIRELGFKDAFIVAFNNGNRISLQMAKELLGQ